MYDDISLYSAYLMNYPKLILSRLVMLLLKNLPFIIDYCVWIYFLFSRSVSIERDFHKKTYCRASLYVSYNFNHTVNLCTLAFKYMYSIRFDKYQFIQNLVIVQETRVGRGTICSGRAICLSFPVFASLKTRRSFLVDEK